MKIKSTCSNFGICLLLLLVVFMSFSCETDTSGERPKKHDKETVNDSIVVKEQVEELKEEPEPNPIIRYHLDSIASAEEVDSFQTRFTDGEKKIIFALNRMDAWRLAAGTQVVIPDSISDNFLTYSPFPEELELLDSIPKTVLINQRVQGFALYENGKLMRWGPTSSGKQTTPTPNGLHYGNHKSKRKVSTVNPDWILPYYFNFMNFEGVGVHQYSMPGYPASHACVRLLEEDARFIYDWAEQWKLNSNGQVIIKNGTPFMVFGEYDYEQPSPPWLRLAANYEDNFLNKSEMDTLESYVKQYFEDERNFVQEETGESELSV